MIETDGYSDTFLDPAYVNEVNVHVHVAIQGADVNNAFTFIAEEGDTTGEV